MHNTSAFATLGKFLDKPAIETDWQGFILHTNQAAKHIFDLPETDSPRPSISDYLPKSAVLLNKITTRKPTPEEGIITLIEASATTGQTHNGDALSLEVSVIGVTNERGSRLLFILRVMHAPMQKSRHQLITRLLNQAKIPMSIIDEGGHFKEVNDAFVEFFGYAANDVIGKMFTLLLAPSSQRSASQMHKEFFKTEKELQAEWNYITAAGENKTVMVTANLLNHFDGQRLQLRTYQDITSHIKIEQHFQQSEAFMHHIFDFADVGIALVNTRGMMTHVNLAFCTLFGYRNSEIIDQAFSRVFNASQREYAHQRYQDAIEHGHMVEDEWKLRLIHGDARHIHTIFRRLTFPDGETRMLIIANDVSIEKKIRSQLIHDKEEAELNLINNNNFLVTLSRKLRTLANPIVGFSDLLESTHLDTEQQDYLETISANCKQLHRFSDDIVEYTHLASNLHAPRSVEIDLDGLLDALKHDIASQLQQHAVVLHTRIAGQCPKKIQGDPLQLRSLIFKLTHHAVAHATDGTVSVDINGSPKTPDNTHVQMAVTITQNGSDVDARQIEKTLQPFANLTPSIPENVHDYELNLAICKSLAANLDASIRCKHDFDDKLRFTIQFDTYIPKAEQTAHTPSNPADSHQRPLCIICADDSPSNRSVIKALVGRLGHQITLVPSGEKLIEVLAQQDFDVVCMDLQMPNMNGYEACEYIRKGTCNGRNAGIQIIATTAHDSAEIHQRCIEVGMNGYLAKPISRDSLERALEACRQNREALAKPPASST